MCESDSTFFFFFHRSQQIVVKLGVCLSAFLISNPSSIWLSVKTASVLLAYFFSD